MSKPPTFQQVVMRLDEYWAQRGCLIWQPYSEKLGAGTANPATTLRVLGPEPWNVGYVEPSYRPDDGRYGENPNRMQMHIQYQVILKPDPGNPQELYLGSLEAIGINMREHDVRFVEDNWEAPGLGAWGLGWEVWLDGQEISQYTYFQQAGGLDLNPVAVELTYGLERIVMYLQRVRAVWDIAWDDVHTYGDILLRPEVEHCIYDFEVADVDRLTQMYDLYEAESKACMKRGLVIPAYDYIQRCSHTFNILDSRGAVGVTERAHYFRRMRDLTRQVAQTYVDQREEMGFPFLVKRSFGDERLDTVPGAITRAAPDPSPRCLLLEIGTEELPVSDLSATLAQLETLVPRMLEELRLAHGPVRVVGTPRRQAALVEDVASRQPDVEETIQGPPAHVAYDAEGTPTRAAEGFARKQDVPVESLRVVEEEGKAYVVAVRTKKGRPAAEVLPSALRTMIADIKFPRAMRWLNPYVEGQDANIAFSRPLRWLVALLGEQILPVTYAGTQGGRTTRGLRPYGSPEIEIPAAEEYLRVMAENQVHVDVNARRADIARQTAALVASVGGAIPIEEMNQSDPSSLLNEVTNLVERPTAVLGQFEAEYLDLPRQVLITVMKKHQRYFPVVDTTHDALLPYFVAVRNGDEAHLELVRQGYEDVLRARYADARFFYESDIQKPVEAYLPRLDTLTFQERLGSMLDKVHRMEKLVVEIAPQLGLDAAEQAVAVRAAHLCKADLATNLVVEFTSLQGIMGRHYARLAGEDEAVAEAIFEHYLPRFAGDALPSTTPGLSVNIAARLDSLVGLFAVGMAPTGSADPFALRRDALALVQILIGREMPFSLKPALAAAAAQQPVAVAPQVLEQVLDFVRERLRGWLRSAAESTLSYDVVDAVLAERGDDPFTAYRTARQLAAWVERDDWMDLLNAYGRCIRIVRAEEDTYPVDPAYLAEPAERALWEAYEHASAQVTSSSSVDRLLTALRPMIPAINRFFDDVLVMHDDERLRHNRMGLLQAIWKLSRGIVDVTRLEGF